MRGAPDRPLSGAAPDATVRHAHQARGTARRATLALLAEEARAATGADVAVAALGTEPTGEARARHAIRWLRVHAGRTTALPDELVARIHDRLHASAGGWWVGHAFVELTGGDAPPGAAGALAAVRLRFGGESGVLGVRLLSSRPDGDAVLGPLSRVAALAPRVADQLHAVVHHERHRLAQALHDTLAQTLTELAFTSDALAEAPGGDRIAIRRTRELVASALRNTRDVLSSALALEDYPLPASVADVALDLRQAGVDVRLHQAAAPVALPLEVDRCVRYAAREALVNIRRHADAKRVDLALESGDGRVLLTVTDDGAGPGAGSRAGARPWSGLGLCLLHGMVEDLRGSLQLAAAPGRGTRLTLSLPLAADDERCDP